METKRIVEAIDFPRSALEVLRATYAAMADRETAQNYLTVVFHDGDNKFTLSLQRENGTTLSESNANLKTATNDLLLALDEYRDGNATLSYVLAYADYVREVL